MSGMIFAGKRIVLGITGSIAAYKAIEIARQLTVAGATVDVIMTEDAAQFVTPLTLQTLTQRPVLVDMFRLLETMEIGHVALGERADALLVAPASANTLAKMAQGVADNLLLTTCLATRAPVLVAPAMNVNMWHHPATQANVAILRERGVIMVGPEHGRLASGIMGEGRLAPMEEILGALRLALGRKGALAGRRVVVTAGGTQEPLDPVRYLGNRSSGKMGYALAQAALDRGAGVTLVTAPSTLRPPVGACVVPVQTALEMHDAVLAASAGADILLMAAAVADYRPAQAAAQKIKKEEKQALALTLERTPDILLAVAEQRGKGLRPAVVVGFAAETEDLLAHARAKLERKHLDLIVANDVSAPDSGFAVDTNRVTLLAADGTVEALPLLSKAEVAERVLEWVVGAVKRDEPDA